ncbi:MAG: hypothetical protein O3A21_06515 [Proteobacteria bacterium]|nr:hypothetical protein [Pseudomonadota bacterium]
MNDDSDLQRRQKAFLFEVEQAIRAANNEIIHDKLPEISREDVYHLAVMVAKLRASYLATAFQLNHMDGDSPDPDLVSNLKGKRETFEEARSAFLALQRAIELGYVDVEKIKASS